MTYVTSFTSSVKTNESLIIKESGGSSTITLQAPSISADYTLKLPVDTGTVGQVLSTNGGSPIALTEWVTSGSGGTFQNVYDGSSPVSFTINDTKDGLVIKDNATPITGDLFTVADNSGTSKFININSSNTEFNVSDFLITKTSAATFTHTGGSGNLIISSGSNVVVESVIFNNGAMSNITTLSLTGNLTTTSGDILLTNTGAQSITHTGGSGNLTISSTSGAVVIKAFTFTGTSISGITDLNISGLFTSSGTISLTKSGDQYITKSGGGSLNITSTGNTVLVESSSSNSTSFSVGSISADSLSSSASALTLRVPTITSSAGDIILTAVSNFSLSSNAGVVLNSTITCNSTTTGITTITGTGDLTISTGDITLSKTGFQEIIKSVSGDLIISATTANVLVESVTFNGSIVTGTTTITMSGELSKTGNISLTSNADQTITKTTAGDLIISATTANVLIESVTFNNGGISGVSTLDMTGNITTTGDLNFTKNGDQAITHTGGSGDLSITSDGNVILGGVVLNGQLVTCTELDTPIITLQNKGSYTQTTNINTTVSTTAKSGNITTVSMTIVSGSKETFNVTNSACTTSSIVFSNMNYSGSGNCYINITPNTGSFDITITNGSGTTLNAVGVISYIIT